MRILFIVNEKPDSGIYTSAKTLADALSEQGIEIDFDKAAHKRYDLIHIHNAMPNNFLRVKLKFPFTPIVASTTMTERELSGLIPSFLLPLAKIYLRIFYGFCRAILANNPALSRDLKQSFPGRVFFTPNFVDRKRFSFSKELADNWKNKWGLKKKIILCVASIQKRKGIFDFLELAKSLPEYQFVWVGGIPDVPTLERRDEIKKIYKENKDITFTGVLNGDDLIGAFSAADLFLFASHSETFGLVIVEAASTGLPVIARDLEVYENFKEFIIVFKDLDDARAKVREILNNREESEKWKKLSLEKSVSFGVKENAQKVKEVYQRIIKQERGDN